MKNAISSSMKLADLISELGTDAKRGLSDSVAAERLAEYGPNSLPEPKKPSIVWLFIKQFRGALMYILIIAGLVSLAVGEIYDAYGIGLALFANAIIGFVLERRAEKAIEKLKKMVVPETVVIRDGRTRRIPSAQVVRGDILVLEEGSRVVADARLILVRELKTDESALTGESLSVSKKIMESAKGTPPADQLGMVWMGTGVVRGAGHAVVVETGALTVFGKIAASLSAIQRGRTPLESRLDMLGKQLGYAAIIMSALALGAGLLRGFPVIDMFFFTVAMIVSIVPEGLPQVLAVVMAIGVLRMAKRNAIVRHLPSVETLGAADIICTDKTGTLTENKMTVREISLLATDVTVSGEGWEPNGTFLVAGDTVRPAELPELMRLLIAASLSSKAVLEMSNDTYHIVGDATDGAMAVVAAKAGVGKPEISTEYTLIDEIPFSSERKYHAVLVERADVRGQRSRVLFVVGALGAVRERTSRVFNGDQDILFDEKARLRFNDANQNMANRSLRVIAIATKILPEETDNISDSQITDLSLLGLMGMIDPPRQGVKQALERCRGAGIRVIMLTGDQKATAVAIGRQIGLLNSDTDGRVFTEKEVSTMSESELMKVLKDAVIFARVSPETKLRVVTGLQKLGHTVAMTGDGVNDAPALKKSAIGVAMGITGSDVTKEVADMVLADDNFISIVNAIEEGRIIFRNVKQATTYLFMTNLGEAVTILAAISFGMPLPLVPLQILWMNIVTDVPPSVALAAEPAGSDMLASPPRRQNEPIISRGALVLSMLTAAVMCIGTLWIFSWALNRGDIHYARTVAFTAMAMFQLWNVFSMRSPSLSMFSLGLFSNKLVPAAAGISVALHLSVLYVPVLQRIFDTIPLGGLEWVVILTVSSSVFFAVEVWKMAMHHNRLPKSLCL